MYASHLKPSRLLPASPTNASKALRFGSVCSGIEAASVAWEPLGFEPAWFSEIEPFPCSVLSHRFPHVPNHGDMTKLAHRILRGEVEAPDVLVGGTPCQAFSIAGRRKGLLDARGNLTLVFVELANVIDQVRKKQGKPPCVIVWENVPGVLSSKDNAFGCFLAGLSGAKHPLCAKRWTSAGHVSGPRRSIAWRSLDAQHFSLAQRRRRVFVVASARQGFAASQILFEHQVLRRDSPPSRQTGKEASNGASTRLGEGGQGVPDLALCLNAGGMGRQDAESETFIPVAFSAVDDGLDAVLDLTPTLRACGGRGTGASTSVATRHGVRKLMPVECERLQGFPDGWTLVPHRGKPAPDGPRYRAIGNSMAVTCMAWLGRRIKERVQA